VGLFEQAVEAGHVFVVGLSLSDVRNLLALQPEVNSRAEAFEQSLSGDVELPRHLSNGVAVLALKDALEHHTQQVTLLLSESKQLSCFLESFGVGLCPVGTEKFVKDGLKDEVHLRLEGVSVSHEH